MSNNLETDRVTGETSGKEAIIDAALEAMDAAITEQVDIDFTPGVDIVLSTAQWMQNNLLKIINAGTSGLDLTVPQKKRVTVVWHKSGANGVNLKRGSTNVSLAPGGTYLAITDGSANGLVALQITLSSSFFSSLVSITADTDLDKPTHEGKFLEVDDASDVTLTILAGADTPWLDNAELEGYQKGVGQVIVVGDAGVTVTPPPGLIAKTLGVGAPFALKRLGNSDDWLISGYLST